MALYIRENLTWVLFQVCTHGICSHITHFFCWDICQQFFYCIISVRFTDSGYSFGILKLFLIGTGNMHCVFTNLNSLKYEYVYIVNSCHFIFRTILNSEYVYMLSNVVLWVKCAKIYIIVIRKQNNKWKV